ncbi:MAG: aldolase [Syntrophomonadaceae bacterium]|nr:aldolase [Syntrophomonadaceae bacterium]
MKLMLVTADLEFTREAQKAGIDRIFLDLEYINKAERQRGRNTLISNNSITDVRKLRSVIDKSEFLVRVNPIHPNSQYEIDKVVEGGADIIMLPMVTDDEDAYTFVSMVNGRTKTCLLLETAQSLVRLDDILNVKGVDEIYIGLNDLHISMNLKFMFELLAGGIVDYMADKINAKGLPFGFGGMAKIGEGILPAENILGEHYRLGSSSVILSRTFRNEVGNVGEKVDFKVEVDKIRSMEKEISLWKEQQFNDNRLFVKECVNKIIKR